MVDNKSHSFTIYMLIPPLPYWYSSPFPFECCFRTTRHCS